MGFTLTDISNLNDTLFSYLTNDIFSFIVYGILLFMIFQIGFIVLFDLLANKNPEDINENSITFILTTRIQKIEKDIVTLACDLLSGCLDLFQFIPSFFDTIGVLLLGNPPKNQNPASPDHQKGTVNTSAPQQPSGHGDEREFE